MFYLFCFVVLLLVIKKISDFHDLLIERGWIEQDPKIKRQIEIAQANKMRY